MKEEFLHFIWKNRLYNHTQMHTINGEEVEIINPGTHNTDAGPDFFNAKIKVDGTLWAGNVEIHVKSSDWFTHKHHSDKNYSNIILHVVYIDDSDLAEIKRPVVPTLQIPISETIISKYRSIYSEKEVLFCSNNICKIPLSEIETYLEYLLIERFEEKYNQARETLEKQNSCWNSLFFSLLLKTFGGFTNNHAFELVAKNLTFNHLLRHSNNLFQLEALLFGVSGFLETDTTDEYHDSLKKEFAFLRTKYHLNPIEPHLWKFLRLRPANFPTIRIAQLAALLYKTKGMFIKIIEHKKNNDIFAMLDVETSEYWNKHYHFGKDKKENWNPSIGEQSKYMIICNVALPFLFTYHKDNGNAEKIEEVMDWLYQLPSEINSVMRLWQRNSILSNNMAQSQALYHLHSRYCNHKRCINCRIGQKVLAKAIKQE